VKLEYDNNTVFTIVEWSLTLR